MRLTNLEIKGFKSFAEKTIINFDDGITGVVGPNGCGKSNVVDAIRWVLGEQKAKTLRLEKMDNVIFNGTKDRKQGHIAEVSLTLDNTKNLIPTEFTSVKITRVLDRSGDSEYKLNGVTCRLKDIRDLFLDTGISTSTYAIIELKMIDDILNDVDGSRRRLFEQAAGISKYKARKKETLSKLQSTEADLNRVEDLLYEIEGNLKSLEKQAKKALKFKELKEDYKLLSVDLAKYEFTGLQEGLAKLKNERQEIEDRRQAVETKLIQVEAKIQETKTTILDKEKSLSEQQKIVNELIAKIQETESDKRVKAQKSEFLNERIERLRLLIQNNNNEIQNLQSEIQNLSDSDNSGYEELDGLRQIQEQAQVALEKFRNEHEEMSAVLQNKRDAYLNVRQDLYDIEKQIVAKETRIENLVQNSQKNLFENTERRKSLNTLESEITLYEKELSKEIKIFNELRSAEEKNLQEQEATREKVENQRQEIADASRILDAKNNEYKLTKNMIDNLEGFPESIKFLKKNAFWLKETPLLSDILYSDEKYRVSLETVLNPYLNNYIVEKEEDALNAISLLKEASVGKASFFVLDYLKNRNITPPITHKNLVPAIEVIEADNKFKNLLSYLLESVYFLKEGADFKAIPDNLIEKNDLFIINENGTLLKSKTTVSGGAIGLFEGKKLGRVKNLEKLEKEISKLQKSLLKQKEEFGKDKKKLEDLTNNQLRKEVEESQRKIQNLEKELVVRKSKMENFHDLLTKHASHEDEMSTTIEEEQHILTEAEEQHKVLSQQVEKDKAALETLESAFKEKNDLLQKRQEEYNKVNIEYLQKEGTLKSQKQSLNFKSTRLAEIDESITNAQNEMQECEKQINTLLKEMKDLEQKLLDQYKEKEKLNKDLTIAETAYYEIKEQVQEFETETFEKRKERDEIDRIILSNKDRFNDLKFELESLRQRLSIEFNIEASKIDTEDLPKISKQELSAKVEKVKKRIDNYGDVNPMAEEAYTEMKNRFDFITEQKEDLTNAKDSLLQTIKEIEDTAEGHFMETFEAVKTNFKMVFQSMFTEGDTCDLKLMNPEDPLETKIEITAKPKGKRPQTINQLSGGEKTLTSLSLLFALYLYKPAPFCILDEVDAPLDDANIDKFNKAIRNFSQNSQFIIVTHNKQTMAEVDVIYGVTMAQKGISKVVPVDFRSLSAN